MLDFSTDDEWRWVQLGRRGGAAMSVQVHVLEGISGRSLDGKDPEDARTRGLIYFIIGN